MKIACIGNCQIETLTWYLRYLLPQSECYWIPFSDRYRGFNFNEAFNHSNKHAFSKEFNDQVLLRKDHIKYVSEADYVISLKMLERASPDFHDAKLKSTLQSNCKYISITNFYLDENNIEKTLTGIRDRDQKRRVDITIDTLVENLALKKFYPKKPTEPNHPPAIYFLELIRHISKKFDWPFFSQEDYDMFIKTGFPFG